MKKNVFLLKVASGSKNLAFADIVSLVKSFGFVLDRVKGSHHIFKHPKISELVNLQQIDGKAKPYQVRQFLELIERYQLRLEEKK